MEHAGQTSAPAWAAALEASAFGEAMRQSFWLYPAANLLHLFGLTLLVGAMIVIDLRLLGAGRAIPLAPLAGFLTPLAVLGLAVLLGSGFALFAADAGPLSTHFLLWLKWALIALGVANALLFRWLWTGRLAEWDCRPPAMGRIQAALSLGVWIIVGTAGRLIAYY